MERRTYGGYSVANLFLILYFILVAVSAFGILAIPALVMGIVAAVIAVTLIAHL